MNLVTSASAVRDYLELNTPGTSSKYSDATINSNIRAAQAYLETECRRFFYDHPGITWSDTTMLQAQVPLPGFRAITSATWGGVALSVAFPGDGNTSPSAWALLEPAPGVTDNHRLAIAMQFRPWRRDNDRPWYMADPLWWDKALDSPFFPGNYGGGYAWTSMPNDLVIVGDGGYAAGTEPEAFIDAVKLLSAFKTQRPSALLTTTSITPAGGVIEYSQLPPEIVEFVADWKHGREAVSAG